MELSRRFKHTEVGPIPQEWEVRTLEREIQQLEAGVSVNSIDEESPAVHDLFILKTSSVVNGIFLPTEIKKVAPRDFARVKTNPRANTIIFSRLNTPDLVGECGYVGVDYQNIFLPDRLWITRFHGESRLCVKWLNYVLNTPAYKTLVKRAATGTSGSMKNISKDALLSILIPYPDPVEQSAIAVALSDVDAMIAALDALIAKKRDMKQAAMQQLLTGKTRLPGFSGAWEVKRLGEYGDFKGGNGFTLKYQGNATGEFPFFEVSDMNNEGNSMFMSNSNHWVPDEVRRLLGATPFPRNSIVFAKIGAAIFLERIRCWCGPAASTTI